MLCDNLEGWDGMGWGGREGQDGGGICILMADSIVLWKKPTQHCKAITLQLIKTNKKTVKYNSSLYIGG